MYGGTFKLRNIFRFRHFTAICKVCDSASFAYIYIYIYIVVVLATSSKDNF